MISHMGNETRRALVLGGGNFAASAWESGLLAGMAAAGVDLRNSDLFVSIGTSGAVYPAAGFVQTARYCGAQTLEINLDPSLGSTFFEESRIGPAGKLVPEWVAELLV